MNKSTYKNHHHFDPNIRTAIIYQIDELFAYHIEIKDGYDSYYVSYNNEPVKFGNMNDARKAAVKEKVKVAYLALSKTYEEVDTSTCHADHQDRYDYSELTLDVK